MTPEFLSSDLDHADPRVASIIAREEERQQSTLELIASENHVSVAVREAVGSVFTNKYAEGYPGRRYYGGCPNMDAIEDLARDRAKELFAAQHANVQPHSGASANLAVYMACLQPGDTVLGLDLSHGGHLTHGSKVNFSGAWFNVVAYGVRQDSERIDMAEVRRIARECKPKLIISGFSAYPRTLDFAAFDEIAREAGARHMSDIAHVAGLVAAGLYPSPVPHADFVTTTTHKTLRGPRGGMILCRETDAKLIDKWVFPGVQGGPLMHVIAGKAVALGEAQRPEFKLYQQRVVANAKALAEALAACGYRLVSGGTDNHLMLIDLRPAFAEVTGKTAEETLEQAGIIVNKNMIPFDDRKPAHTSGLRLGTPALTTRGMGLAEMKAVAGLIHSALGAVGDEPALSRIRGQVRDLCAQFPVPH